MFSKIKMYLLSAIAAAFTGLFLLLKWTQSKRDKAVYRAEKAEREVIEQTELANTQSDLNRAQSESRKEAANHAKEQKPTTARPTGSFGDKRLHNKD